MKGVGFAVGLGVGRGGVVPSGCPDLAAGSAVFATTKDPPQRLLHGGSA